MTPLSIPGLAPDAGTLAAALAYATAGMYVAPVAREDRRNPGKNPGSILGEGWQRKTSRDPKQIAAWLAGKDHGIALHCGRSGLIVFDVDKPDNLPEGVKKYLDAAPYQSTRPDTLGRGHYIFAQPPGRTIGNGTGKLGGAWGEIRGLNGVIIAAPSWHPEGGLYRWERTGVIPVLPDELAQLLDDAASAEDSATDAEVAAFIAEHTTATRPEVINGLRAALLDKIEAGESRHDSAVPVVAGVMKEARAGYYSAQHAIDTIKPIFINAVQIGENKRTEDEANDEWDGLVAWAVAQALAADLDEVRARVEEKMPNNIDFGTAADFFGIAEETIHASKTRETLAEPTDLLSVQHIEEDFWDRESLRTIHNAALTRMCSPWAVLANCSARVLAQVRPDVVLPPTIGTKGSLNWFAINVALSGGGKGAASGVAKELVPGDIVVRTPGSGEGTVQAYIIREPKGVFGGYRPAVMFEATEVDNLGAVSGRSGATLLSTLRQGFSGETLGFAYADAKKNDHIAEHTYRMTFVLSVQPAQAGPLFAGEGGGTPQRFMWFPGTDSRVTVEAAGDWIGTLPLPDLSLLAEFQRYGRTLTIPDEARDLIRAERAKAMRGEQNGLDGHALFCRLKFAYALTILDGRTEMSFEDWRLSGIAAAVSTHTREWCAEQMVAGQRRDAAKAGELYGVRQEAADNEKVVVAAERVHRVLRWVLTKLDDAGVRVTNRELSRAVSSRDRPALKPALELGKATGQLGLLDDGVTWEKL